MPWTQQPAVVARIGPDGALHYLADVDRSAPLWVDDALDGLLFSSFREANHFASELPDELKAFSLLARIAPPAARAQPCAA